MKVADFIKTLRHAEVLPEADQKLLSYDDAQSEVHDRPLARAMGFICRSDPDLYNLPPLPSLPNKIFEETPE